MSIKLSGSHINIANMVTPDRRRGIFHREGEGERVSPPVLDVLVGVVVSCSAVFL